MARSASGNWVFAGVMSINDAGMAAGGIPSISERSEGSLSGLYGRFGGMVKESPTMPANTNSQGNLSQASGTLLLFAVALPEALSASTSLRQVALPEVNACRRAWQVERQWFK